jgi:hypothetical protein
MKNSVSLFHRGWLPLVILFLFLPCPGRAATLTVANTLDSGPGSLRQAIADAASGDMINFANNVAGTITLTSGELLVNKSLTIAGPGSGVLAVSGSHSSRVFRIEHSSVTCSGLSVIHGRVAGSSSVPLGEGGIFSFRSILTLDHCLVSGNSVSQSGGGLFNACTQPGNAAVTISN